MLRPKRLAVLAALAAGILPLSAQSTMQDGGHVDPNAPTTLKPEAPPGANTLQPGVNAPPPGVAPPPAEMPVEPVIHAKITEFTVSPTTYREGMLYKEDLKTTIRLNVPAQHRMVFHIVSSDPASVSCTDVIILKNVQSAHGGIKVSWKAIHRDSEFQFKAFAEDNPELVFYGRIYLKKKLE